MREDFDSLLSTEGDEVILIRDHRPRTLRAVTQVGKGAASLSVKDRDEP